MSQRKRPYAGADARTKQAKSMGYPARSVFKLEEIDRRVKLLKPGQRVLDLGAAPGSWTLYASQRVGPSGHVVAVDLKKLEQAFGANVTVLQGDALAMDSELLAAHAPYDLVLSDMAPNTSGSKLSDQARSFELFSRAVDVASALGKPGSGFVAKLFMGPDFQQARAAVAARWRECRVIRPEGTRRQSTEVFVIGLGLAAQPVA